jgi:multidrug efflux pump subunit AcrB
MAWEFFIRNTRFSYLLMVALLGFGVFAIVAIPKESAPEVEIPVGVVTTTLPGAPATDIETLITNELERGINGSVSNISKLTSTSREGVSSIVVEFDAGADVDESLRDLRDRVDQLRSDLPETANDPQVTEVDFVDQPVLTFAVAGDRTDDEFVTLADELEIELEAVPGVSRVETSGVRTREISVLVDSAALLRFNLTINEVIQAISSANSTFPIGAIITDELTINLAFEGDLRELADVAAVPITTRGGQPVYVRDVARVTDSLTAPTTFSRLSVAGAPSENAITFSVYKQRGDDVTRVTAAAQARLAELQAPDELLQGLSLYTIQDAGELVRADLWQLTNSGIQTVILVLVALMIAIGWREGVIAATSIPLSFTIGFIGLYLSGNTINFLSLFALILGIGVLVDSAIVMVEGINTRMKSDPTIDKVQAALLSIREFHLPLLSGTLTTVAMFVGLFIVSGVTGQFIAAIPFTLIFILFASLLVAIGFIPLIASSFLRRRSSTRLERLQVEYSHRLEEWYRRKLRFILEKRSRKVTFLVSIIVGFISAIALIPLGLVQVEFFSQSNSDQLFIEIELPEGSTKPLSDIAARRVEELLYTRTDMIEAFAVTVGGGSAFTGGGTNAKLASIYVALRDDRPLTSAAFADELRAAFQALPDLDITITQADAGPPTGAAIGVRLSGDNLADLNQAAVTVSRLVREIEGTTNVTTSADSNATEIAFVLDTAKTAAVGLNPLVVSQTLRAAVFGAEATSITTLTDATDVVVRLNLTEDTFIDPSDANRTTLDRVTGIELATPAGERVLLSSLITPVPREASTAIAHEDLERVVTVSADLTPTGNVRVINEEITRRLTEDVTLPAGVRYTLGGETEESDQAFGELFLALIVGIVLMIIVLVLQFDSYLHTFYVLSILPFSLIGILYGLMFTGSALSFPSIMGFIALSGIVVNNSILLIDQMNNVRREQPTLPIREVVLKAASSRLRPILLTSLTTIIGMIPLLTTDEIWIPLATAVMFGLAFSVIITLVLVPVIYSKFPGQVRS